MVTPPLREHPLPPNTVEAAIRTDVDSFVCAPSNHAAGLYDVHDAPERYYPGFGLNVDHTVTPRPDSTYGAQKVYTEGLGRLAAEVHGIPFFAPGIGAVLQPRVRPPYGHAERKVAEGEVARGSEASDEQVARMTCLWQSRRDVAHMDEFVCATTPPTSTSAPA